MKKMKLNPKPWMLITSYFAAAIAAGFLGNPGMWGDRGIWLTCLARFPVGLPVFFTRTVAQGTPFDRTTLALTYLLYVVLAVAAWLLKGGATPAVAFLHSSGGAPVFHGRELIILTNSFQKKSQNTPQGEIRLAEERKADYLSRRKHNG